jgi:hypothetical protein
MTHPIIRGILLGAIVISQEADALATIRGVAVLGTGPEQNPIMRAMLGAPLELLALKILLGVVVALVLLIRWDDLKRIAWPFAVLVAGFGFFCASTGIISAGLL